MLFDAKELKNFENPEKYLEYGKTLEEPTGDDSGQFSEIHMTVWTLTGTFEASWRDV